MRTHLSSAISRPPRARAESEHAATFDTATPLAPLANGSWPASLRGPGRAGRSRWARRGIGRAVLLTGALVAWAGSFPAHGALPEGGAVDLARDAWVPALLGRSWPAGFHALDEMRADPELARQALLLAITEPTPPPERWRLIRHLAEFGQVDDIPVVLGLLDKHPDPPERRFAMGTARALYPRYDPPADLTRAVSDFIFLQTRPPQPFDSTRENSWVLTTRALEEYHRAQVPLDVIAALPPLRDRPFPDRAALAAAMQKALPSSDWRSWQDNLLAPLELLPPRVELEGILRVRVFNPTDRPLLAQVSFGIWRAYFQEEPAPGFVFVKPGEESRYEAQVRVFAPIGPYPARIDLRLREVHHQPQPLYRRLAIPTQP